MNTVDAVAAFLFLGVTAYALFAGADFGSGFWDLTAGGDRRGAPVRTLVDHSIGPVWEANHVWLIFVLVFLWTGFPRGFTAIATTASIPLALALTGIVLRGAGFAFRKFAATLSGARAFGVVFALSSVITPFFFGAIVGGIVSGRVPADGYGDRWTSWTGPTSMLGGTVAVLTCAYLAGVLLTADAERGGDGELAERLRRRVLVLAVLTGLVVTGGVIVLRDDAHTLFERLLGRAVWLVVLSGWAGTASVVALVRRRYALARVAAGAAVASVVVGWGVAQYPWMLVDRLTLAGAAGAHATLVALLIVGAAAIVIVVPSLLWLFRLVNDTTWSGATPD